MEKIVIGADHGGFELKLRLVRQLKEQGYQSIDAGTFSSEPCDYPFIGAKVAKFVSDGKPGRGILLCKSGGGMAVVANKFPGVRAVVCQTVVSAKHAREHNDANVLVLGAEHLPFPRAQAILQSWLKTPFGGGRHARRIRQIERIEKTMLCEKKRSGR